MSTPEQAFKAGDDEIGVPVLEEFYEKMKSKPTRPDLAALWSRLGVRTENDTTFDDSDPEAAIRQAISAPRSPLAVERAAPSARH